MKIKVQPFNKSKTMEKQIRLTRKESISESLLTDIIYAFTNWENNWSESDFEDAFKKSSVGWEWLWDKFESSQRRPFNFYLCLDHRHQLMLVRYIFEDKHKDIIQNCQANRAIFEKLFKQQE